MKQDVQIEEVNGQSVDLFEDLFPTVELWSFSTFDGGGAAAIAGPFFMTRDFETGVDTRRLKPGEQQDLHALARSSAKDYQLQRGGDVVEVSSNFLTATDIVETQDLINDYEVWLNGELIARWDDPSTDASAPLGNGETE